MKTATAYTNGWVHAILLAAAFGCGGGGGDSYDGDTGMVEPPNRVVLREDFESYRGYKASQSGDGTSRMDEAEILALEAAREGL